MRKSEVKLWKKEEYHYALAAGFIPKINLYIQETEQTLPIILVVPGGCYCSVSPTEGEVVARHFLREGYHVGVLTYTVNPLMIEPLKTQPLMDISRAVRYIRKEVANYFINPDKVYICGFSAGGHLCASLCVHYEDVEDTDTELRKFSNRPNAAILSYPVITSGEFANRDSFTALLGKDATKESLEYMSLEKHVSQETPPCFIWQTAPDELVPVENSYLFADACRKHGVHFAHHVFSQGKHGLSSADEAWAAGDFGDEYTMEQIRGLIADIKANRLQIDENRKKEFLDMYDIKKAFCEQPNEEVRVWITLALDWLKEI